MISGAPKNVPQKGIFRKTRRIRPPRKSVRLRTSEDKILNFSTH